MKYYLLFSFTLLNPILQADSLQDFKNVIKENAGKIIASTLFVGTTALALPDRARIIQYLTDDIKKAQNSLLSINEQEAAIKEAFTVSSAQEWLNRIKDPITVISNTAIFNFLGRTKGRYEIFSRIQEYKPTSLENINIAIENLNTVNNIIKKNPTITEIDKFRKEQFGTLESYPRTEIAQSILFIKTELNDKITQLTQAKKKWESIFYVFTSSYIPRLLRNSAEISAKVMGLSIMLPYIFIKDFVINPIVKKINPIIKKLGF